MSKVRTESFEDFEKELLEKEEFKNNLLEINASYEIMRALVQARIDSDLTQKQLSELSGVSQADISRIENGKFNPSIKLLQRLAASMNTHIELKFIPNT